MKKNGTSCLRQHETKLSAPSAPARSLSVIWAFTRRYVLQACQLAGAQTDFRRNPWRSEVTAVAWMQRE
jgi:hypothetical protein